MKPDISIICAIYNSERTIRRCIDSILSQSETNFELILVNDGSIDSSGRICDEYALSDSRVKIVHKENEGVAATRQVGIEIAAGEYMMHVDPDDWIEPDALQIMLNAVRKTNALIAICDYCLIERNGMKIIRQSPATLTSSSMIEGILDGYLLGGVCNKLISRKLYGGGTKFTRGIDYCEDVLYLAELCSFNNFTISYVDKPLYNYDKSEGLSITSGKFTKQKYRSYKRFISQLGIVYPCLSDNHLTRMVSELALKAFANDFLTPKEFYEDFHKQRKYIKLSKYSKFIHALVYLSTFGMYVPCRYIHKIYLGIRK